MPEAELQEREPEPITGFRIPAPKGIRPLMNPRVAVGDERLVQDEDGLYVPREEASTRPRTNGRKAAPPVPDEAELDELGQEYDSEEPVFPASVEKFLADPPPAVAPFAPAPAPTPAPVAAVAAAPALTLPSISIEDTDRLWDWIRADGDQGSAFFGRPLSNSLELHDLMKGFLTAEKAGTGCVRAIYMQTYHVGILALVPILSTERVALMNFYLRQTVRTASEQFLVPLVALSLQLVPGYHVGVMAFTPQQAQVYQTQLGPHGFKAHTLFIR